jgi:hypothetical protein
VEERILLDAMMKLRAVVFFAVHSRLADCWAVRSVPKRALPQTTHKVVCAFCDGRRWRCGAGMKEIAFISEFTRAVLEVFANLLAEAGC